MSHRRKVILLTVCAPVVLVFALLILGSRDQERDQEIERSYLLKLETGNAEERRIAWEWISKNAPFKVWKYTQADLQRQFPYHDFGPLQSEVQMPGSDIRAGIRKQVAESGQAALPEYLSSLDSASWLFRCLAVISIGELGPSAKAAIPKLEALVLSDPQVRYEAEVALLRIEPR